MEKKKLENKVAVITGAGSGIGAAVSRRLAEEGALLVINDINEKGLQSIAANIANDKIKICAGDITRTADAGKIIDTALSFGRGLDILINSAGIDPPDREEEINRALDIWNRVIEVNLTGSYIMMKLAVPHMVKNGGGAMVNIASLSGIRYMGGRPSYTASKGGMISLTQMAAVEYGPVNVRCNVICPGPVRTPLFTNNMRPLADMLGMDIECLFSRFTSFSPMRRMGTPEEIAAICSFLVSDDASLITGNVIIADGGSHLVDVNGAAMSGLVPPPENHRKSGK